MAAEKPLKSGPADRVEGRIDVTKYRVNATLALLNGNVTTGYLVQLKDISKTGVGLYSKIEADEGTEIRISVDGLDGASMDGHIVWCATVAFDPSAPPNHEYRIGIEFAPKDDRAREAQITSYRYLAKLAGQPF